MFLSMVVAAAPPSLVGSEHPSDAAPASPEYLPEQDADATSLDLPEIPEYQPLFQKVEPQFVLQEVNFNGNTVFSDAKLLEIVGPFLYKQMSVSDLEEMRYQLTRFYVDQGYVNSGAVIEPGQSLDDGEVTFSIREGTLNEVAISGTGWLRKSYVRQRLWPDADKPFNTEQLQERFQMLLQDPLIERMNGRIRPGIEPGSSRLELDVDRARPYFFSIGADNHRPPSTGAERLSLDGELRNLTGFGDALSLGFGFSRGADELAVGYSLPITAQDTRLTFGYAKSENSVLEEPLDELDIDSKFRSFDVGLTHPVIQTLRRRFELGLTFSRRRVETFLEGESFPFSPPAPEEGDDNAGESLVSVLRFSQDWVNRGAQQALALRSTFNFGIHALNATSHAHAPDGQFFAWLGQMQYSRQMPVGGGRVILRGDVQLANDELMPLERIAVGGARTVRGYRENELVRDNGYVLSLEWRQPILYGEWLGWSQAPASPLLQLAPFMDYGSAWNRDQPWHRDHLHAVGLGVLATPHQLVYGELYWGYAIAAPADKSEYDLQDDGIHFQVTLNLL